MSMIGGYITKSWKWILQKIYHFDKWHVTYLQEREYALDVIRFANRHSSRMAVCEIGCGLGDIVKNLRYKKRVGLDNSPEVLKAARFLSTLQRSKPIEYRLFNFPGDSLNGRFDTIIMVNWIHHIHPDVLRAKIAEYFDIHLTTGGVIVIDTVQDKAYEFNHDIAFLTNNLTCQLIRIGEYKRQREVWAIKKIDT